MKLIEEFISPLVQEQFPNFYKEEGEAFIAFVKAYYEWAENNLQLVTFYEPEGFNVGDTITMSKAEGGTRNATIIANYGEYYILEMDKFDLFACRTDCNGQNLIYSSSGGVSYIEEEYNLNHEFLSRKLFTIKDIDTTIDRFIVNFKNKYLPDIQFNTETNKQLFIKNALDFYRAKGTERALELFFKLVYGLESKVYYPNDDVFRLSDNTFIKVRYLELQPKDTNVQFVGQTVRGITSGAEAYAERLIRVKKGSRFIEVLHLSNLVGNFITGENVRTTRLSSDVTTRILGSLSSAEVVSSALNYQTGDILSIINGAGKGGKFRVETVNDFTGIVDFELLANGWGYTSEAQVLGSEEVIQLNNVTNENTNWYQDLSHFRRFESVRQDLVELTANSVSGDISEFSVGTSVDAYNSSSSLLFSGKIVSAFGSDIVINYDIDQYPNIGTFTDTTLLYTTGNTESIEINTVSDITVTANVIATGANSTIVYTLQEDTDIQVGDTVYQINDRGVEFANAIVDFTRSDVINDIYEIDITQNVGSGCFRSNLPFYRKSDDSVYGIESIRNVDIGVVDITIDRRFYEDGIVYGTESGTKSPSRNFAYVTPANFLIGTFDDTKSYTLYHSPDVIDSIDLNTIIDSASYGLSGDPSAGYTDLITDVITYNAETVGSINNIIVTSPGSEYAKNPFFIIYEPKTFHADLYDYVITYTNENANYTVGEVIEGNTSGAKAVINSIAFGQKTIYATRISSSDLKTDSEDFQAGESITGADTGVTSIVSYVNVRRKEPRSGLNAKISSETFTGEGVITEVSILDSGFGYEDGEQVIAQLDRDTDILSTFNLSIETQGVAPGYFQSRKGFLSSDKYLHDNDFYQEYSYEIMTSLPFDVYKKTLIDALHVAGTKPFGKYLATSVSTLNVNISTKVSTTELIYELIDGGAPSTTEFDLLLDGRFPYTQDEEYILTVDNEGP